MADHPALNDKINDLLYKLANNLYLYGVKIGATNLSEPSRGETDFALLKKATENAAIIAEL